MIPFNNRLFPEAILFNLKAIQTVDSGLLRLKLQMKCEPFSKLTYARYARCCSYYDDFRYRHKCLVDRLLSQGYKALRLEKSFKKFYSRYQDLIEKYQRSVNAMVSDSFPGQFLFNM